MDRCVFQLAVTVLAALLLLSVPVSADHATDPVTEAAEPLCTEANAIGEDQGVSEPGNHSGPAPYETDPLGHAGSCREVRDDAEEVVWGDNEMPRANECKRFQGRLVCAGINMGHCDVRLYVFFSLHCIGGVYPRN